MATEVVSAPIRVSINLANDDPNYIVPALVNIFTSRRMLSSE